MAAAGTQIKELECVHVSIIHDANGFSAITYFPAKHGVHIQFLAATCRCQMHTLVFHDHYEPVKSISLSWHIQC